MDIVSRIKKFLETRQIAISQFADTCNIPRPTISQILNGRNKKISDELIGKIHAGFPELSMLWLMFGEGEMLNKSNIQISDDEIEYSQPFKQNESTDHEIFSGDKIDFSLHSENRADNFGNLFDSQNVKIEAKSPIQNENPKDDLNKEESKLETIALKIAESNTMQKKITNIVVFYDDSTFQTFAPSY